MADTMSFPQTIEEFMDQYKVVDTEQVYSNGVEFVPIFRVKQWLKHSEKHGHWIDGVRCSVCGELTTALDGRYCENCGARMDAQIGEDKSHPFAESVMMGMDEVEE